MLPEEKNELPDLLRELRGRGDGLRAPGPDYFERLADRAMAEPRRTARVRRLPPRWLAAAAAVLLLAFAWVVARQDGPTEGQLADNTPLTSDQLIDQLDPELIDYYISENLHEFDLEYMLSTANEE